MLTLCISRRLTIVYRQKLDTCSLLKLSALGKC